MTRKPTFMILWTGCAMVVLALVTTSRTVSAQNRNSEKANFASCTYFPYPSGVIPPDLQTQINRVNGEIDLIEAEALAQWQALPINPGTAMRQVQLLGKIELYDRNLSVNGNQACTSCHMPYTSFTGPISSVNALPVAYPGSVQYRFGKRKPNAYAYSTYFPVLRYNQTQANFYGGSFWDGRATGYKLQNPDAEQAQDPLRDTQEMGMPDSACIVYRISQGKYSSIFETVWGPQAFAINWPSDIQQICSTPAGAPAFAGNPEPVNLSPVDRGRSNATFDQYALSISAYEGSPDVSAFSSKFDAYLAGTATLTPDEQAGYNLFRGKGNCNSCHLDGRGTTLTAGETDKPGKAASVAPLFTDFTLANLGLPKNPADPIYYESVPDCLNFTPNPAGFGFTDLGMGSFLRSTSNPNSDWTALAPKFDGFMQVSTARNVDMRPCSTFVKSYMHNGYLKSLKEVVHFYNTRDVYAYPVMSRHCPPGTTEKVNCWPQPEVPQTKDMTVGNLGLSAQEENQIVAFLKTLTDGFTRPYPDFKAFSGTCSH
jgi:cytochrome c peroxidase